MMKNGVVYVGDNDVDDNDEQDDDNIKIKIKIKLQKKSINFVGQKENASK